MNKIIFALTAFLAASICPVSADSEVAENAAATSKAPDAAAEETKEESKK